jgi:hypothetical protein
LFAEYITSYSSIFMVVPKKLTTDILSKVKAYNSCESKERGALNRKANPPAREDAAADATKNSTNQQQLLQKKQKKTLVILEET